MVNDDACARIVAAVMAEEGGIADVGDGAGLTRFGQTPAWLQTWGLPTPETAQDAQVNYRRWLGKTHLDELTGLSEPLALAVIDAAVNSGQGEAIRALQKVLSVPQTGRLDEVTLKSAAGADATRLVIHFYTNRVRYYGHLVHDSPAQAKFLNGWLDRALRPLEAFLGVPRT